MTSSQLGLIHVAQLVRVVFAGVMGSIPIQARIFFRFYFHNYLSCVYNFYDVSSVKPNFIMHFIEDCIT